MWPRMWILVLLVILLITYSQADKERNRKNKDKNTKKNKEGDKLRHSSHVTQKSANNQKILDSNDHSRRRVQEDIVNDNTSKKPHPFTSTSKTEVSKNKLGKVIKTPEIKEKASNINECPNCKESIEHMKQFRIEQIKQKILKETGLESIPNITGVVMSQTPQLLERVQETNNQPSTNINKDFLQKDLPYLEDEIKIEEVFVPAEAGTITLHDPPHPAVDVLSFNITKTHHRSSIRSAKLHLWLKAAEGTTDKEVFVSIFKLVNDTHKSQRIIRKEVITVRKEVNPSEGRWHSIEMYKVATEWMEKPYLNLGFIVLAFDSKGRYLAQTDVSSKNGKFPLLQLLLESSKYGRRKRTAQSSQCAENSLERMCCMLPLTIDFVAFKWDFIVAPKVYQANFCNGKCGFRHAQSYPHTLLVQGMNDTNSRSGPCCGAKKLAPLKMLYYDHKHRIRFDTLNDMVVENCACD